MESTTSAVWTATRSLIPTTWSKSAPTRPRKNRNAGKPPEARRFALAAQRSPVTAQRRKVLTGLKVLAKERAALALCRRPVQPASPDEGEPCFPKKIHKN